MASFPSRKAFRTQGGLTPVSRQDLEDNTCPICTRIYHSGTIETKEHPEPPIKLPCGHIFGLNCILQWTDGQDSHGANNCCPFCRSLLFDREADPASRGGRALSYDNGSLGLDSSPENIDVFRNSFSEEFIAVIRGHQVPSSSLNGTWEEVLRPQGASTQLASPFPLPTVWDALHWPRPIDPVLLEFDALRAEEEWLERQVEESQQAMAEFLEHKRQWLIENGDLIDRQLIERETIDPELLCYDRERWTDALDLY